MAEVETQPSTLDTSRLSSFLDIDQLDLQQIIDSAAEGVVFLLQQVQVKATECEQIRNAKDMLEINYGMDLLFGGERVDCRARGAYDEC